MIKMMKVEKLSVDENGFPGVIRIDGHQFIQSAVLHQERDKRDAEIKRLQEIIAKMLEHMENNGMVNWPGAKMARRHFEQRGDEK